MSMATCNQSLTSLTAGPLEFRITETNPETDPRWESFLLEHPDSSIYHHPAWLKALELEYGQKGVYLLCENSAGQVSAILPMLYTRGLPFGLGRPLAGRRLSSLPRTPLGGPLSIDPRATIALLQAAVQRVTQTPGVMLQLKTEGPKLDGLIDGVVSAPWRLSYILQLPDAGKDFRISDSHQRSVVRWSVNKAQKLGVEVRPAESQNDLRSWYTLYLETMRRSIVPPRPYRFFAALWELLKPRGLMQLLVAEQEINGERRIIAGSIFLTLGKTVSYSFNASQPKDSSLRPNDVILWQAINIACKGGAKFFDFGEVPEGHDDLAKFKRKWGAKPVRLYRYYFPEWPGLKDNSTDSEGWKDALGKAVWRRLPIWAISWLGNQIFARL